MTRNSTPAMSAQVIQFPAQRIRRQEADRISPSDGVKGLVADHYLNALQRFKDNHGRPLNSADKCEWAEYEALVKAEQQACAAKVLPFTLSRRQRGVIDSGQRDRRGLQAVDELIAGHLGLETVGLFKGIEARYGLPWEHLTSDEGLEALKWGLRAERGALAVRQFLKELEGRFLEGLAQQLTPPKPRRRKAASKPRGKPQATKGGAADA